MATAGFIIPKVNFISVTLDGGKDLLKPTNEPHIYDLSDTSGPIPSDALANSESKMQVDIVMSIEVGFDNSSCNLFSSFFQDDFTKYLKILVVQSTDASVSNNLASTPKKYFDHSDFLLKALYQELGLSTDLVSHALISFSQFEGNMIDLDNNPLTDDSTSIEKKTDENGNIVYVFPYKITFEVPTARGGIDVQNLDYFVQAYIDVEEIFIDEGAFNGWKDLDQNIINNLTSGEVNRLSVIQGGTTSFFGKTFYVTELDAQGKPKPLNQVSNAAIWTGPVHYHGPQNPGPNGYVGYMAGTNDDMGVYLVAETVFNGIIQDFREIVEITKLDFNYSLFSNSWFNQKTTESLQNNLNGIKQIAARDNAAIKDEQDIETAIVKSLSNASQRPLFADFYTAMDGSGNTRYFFGLDFKEALKQNTAFPKLLENIFESGTEQEKSNLLSNSLIEDFKIYRHKVYKENVADPTVDLYEIEKNDIPKLVVVTKDDSSGTLITTSNSDEDGNLLGTIREQKIELLNNSNGSNYNTRFFTGTDLGTPNDGAYVFSVEITISDPMIQWLSAKIIDMESVLYGSDKTGILGTGFIEYVQDAKSKPAYFNLYTNRFTQQGIEYLDNKYSNLFIYSRIYEFFQILSSFTEFDDKIYGLYNFMTSISSTSYGNPTGALTSLQVMENIYKKILNLFSSVSKYKKPVDSQHVESQYSAGSNPKRNFKITKQFSSKVDGSLDHLTGYDFLSKASTTSEDSLPTMGLKRVSRPSYENRVNLETKKLFTDEDYNIEIPKKPLSYSELENLGPSQIEQKQGPIMNPNDTVAFTKSAFLSPSLVNFRTATNQPLLNNGNMRTDIKNLKNVMLNIVRYNASNGQKLDAPFASMATGQGDEIVKKQSSTESKFDLLTLLSNRQTTVSALEILKQASPKNKTTSGIMGGIGAPVSNLAASEIMITSKDNAPGTNIYNSKIDPSPLLLTIIQQSLFKVLEDDIWSWEYYVENFDSTFFKEYLAYGILAAFGGGTGGQGQVPAQSPLTRAPNHLKSLMINLDYTRDKPTSAMEEVYQQVKSSKPYVFDVDADPESSLQGGYLINKDGKATAAAGNKIMYQNPEFLPFFMLNFKTVAKVEVLSGYETDQYGKQSLNSPIWKLLTQDVYNSCIQKGGNVLCRLMPYEKEMYGIKSYEFMKLPYYNEYFIVDFSITPALEEQLAQGAIDQQNFDNNPFLEPDSRETLPGGQTMEEAEALVGLDGGAAGIGIATGLSAGAVTELGMTGFRGGAAGGVDVGTGRARAAGPLGGGSGPLLGLIAKIGSQSGVSGVGSGALQNSMVQPQSSQQSPARSTARDTGGAGTGAPPLAVSTATSFTGGSQY
jgi:hypothetical protein